MCSLLQSSVVTSTGSIFTLGIAIALVRMLIGTPYWPLFWSAPFYSGFSVVSLFRALEAAGQVLLNIETTVLARVHSIRLVNSQS